MPARPPLDRRAGPPDREALNRRTLESCLARFLHLHPVRPQGRGARSRQERDVRRQTVRPEWACGSPNWVVPLQTSEASDPDKGRPAGRIIRILHSPSAPGKLPVRREAGPPRPKLRRSRPHTQRSPTTQFGRVTSACSCSDPSCASASSSSTGRRAHSSSVTAFRRLIFAVSASATIPAMSEATTTCSL